MIGSGSSGNCYRVSIGEDALLLEAGLPFRLIREALRFRLNTVQGVLISHSHGDHSKSAKDMVKAGIDVFCLPQTASELGLSGHRVHPITPLQSFTVGKFTVLPFPVSHDVPNVGYLIAHGEEKAVYLTDAPYCPYRFQGLTTVLIEANYATDILDANAQNGHLVPSLRNRIVRSHMSLETVKGFLHANDLSRVESVYLLHLSDGNADAARFKREVSEITGRPTYIA